MSEDQSSQDNSSNESNNNDSTLSSYEFNSNGYENTNYTNPNSTNYYVTDVNTKKHKKPGKLKRVMSYVLVGVLCAGIGGGASLGAALYVLPNTNFFSSTPLYKTVAGNQSTASTTSSSSSYSYHATTVASENSGLTVTDIVKKVSPAVVTVSIKGFTNTIYGQQAMEGVGTGMIISQDGYILTNYHVVSGATSVKVQFSSGKEVNAKVVNYDDQNDIAVIQVTDKVTMPGVVELGDSSSLQVGESVVAIGNPLGKEFSNSVTTGIVSGLNRQLEENGTKYIQTDAAINSGNSGGPLLNSKGQVIGINSAKLSNNSQQGTSTDATIEGMGFAIPINIAKDKLPTLSKQRLMLGITAEDYDQTTFQSYSLPQGVLVDSVTRFGAADNAGIQKNDVITKFDGKAVKTVAEINTLKDKHKANDVIKVEIYRDGQTQTVSVKLTTN
ncbi:trypsin-like peptidase domain-containing protein [Clostridium sp. 19966]|nr:trypsin-like peptidase domain-containing protein [Clostridium sp. 19966]